jgi:hypothetical protein
MKYICLTNNNASTIDSSHCAEVLVKQDEQGE